MRQEYKNRQTALVRALTESLGDVITVGNTDAGLNLVVYFPPGLNDRCVSAAAEKAGIRSTPMSLFYMTDRLKQGLFLGFGGVAQPEIVAGVSKLDGVIRTAIGR